MELTRADQEIIEAHLRKYTGGDITKKQFIALVGRSKSSFLRNRKGSPGMSQVRR